MRIWEKVIALIAIVADSICAVALYRWENKAWIVAVFCAVFLSLELISREMSEKDIITIYARNGDLTGLFNYAYYVAAQELEIKSALEKGRISKIHARILLKYCSYRIGKSLRMAQRAFNLDYDDLRKRIDEFAEDKFRKEKEYRRRVEELQKDDNVM